jgi:hypothetical protein
MVTVAAGSSVIVNVCESVDIGEPRNVRTDRVAVALPAETEDVGIEKLVVDCAQV